MSYELSIFVLTLDSSLLTLDCWLLTPNCSVIRLMQGVQQADETALSPG
jgi:hypothetical protein